MIIFDWMKNTQSFERRLGVIVMCCGVWNAAVHEKQITALPRAVFCSLMEFIGEP